jgi:hypothetical protein
VGQGARVDRAAVTDRLLGLVPAMDEVAAAFCETPVRMRMPSLRDAKALPELRGQGEQDHTGSTAATHRLPPGKPVDRWLPQ